MSDYSWNNSLTGNNLVWDNWQIIDTLNNYSENKYINTTNINNNNITNSIINDVDVIKIEDAEIAYENYKSSISEKIKWNYWFSNNIKISYSWVIMVPKDFSEIKDLKELCGSIINSNSLLKPVIFSDINEVIKKVEIWWLSKLNNFKEYKFFWNKNFIEHNKFIFFFPKIDIGGERKIKQLSDLINEKDIISGIKIITFEKISDSIFEKISKNNLDELKIIKEKRYHSLNQTNKDIFNKNIYYDIIINKIIKDKERELTRTQININVSNPKENINHQDLEDNVFEKLLDNNNEWGLLSNYWDVFIKQNDIINNSKLNNKKTEDNIFELIIFNVFKQKFLSLNWQKRAYSLILAILLILFVYYWMGIGYYMFVYILIRGLWLFTELIYKKG